MTREEVTRSATNVNKRGEVTASVLASIAHLEKVSAEEALARGVTKREIDDERAILSSLGKGGSEFIIGSRSKGVVTVERFKQSKKARKENVLTPVRNKSCMSMIAGLSTFEEKGERNGSIIQFVLTNCMMTQTAKA